MSQILELAQLVDEHGVAEMQIRRGRVETGLDAQASPGFQAFHELAFDQYFIRATLDQCQRFVVCGHVNGFQ